MHREIAIESARAQHQRTRDAPTRPRVQPTEGSPADGHGPQPATAQAAAAAPPCHSPSFAQGIAAETWRAVHGVAVQQRRFGPWRYKPKDPKALLPSKAEESQKELRKEALRMQPSFELPPRDFSPTYASHVRNWSDPGINVSGIEKLLMSPPNVEKTDPFAMAEARKGTRAERVSLASLFHLSGE